MFQGEANLKVNFLDALRVETTEVHGAFYHNYYVRLKHGDTAFPYKVAGLKIEKVYNAYTAKEKLYHFTKDGNSSISRIAVEILRYLKKKNTKNFVYPDPNFMLLSKQEFAEIMEEFVSTKFPNTECYEVKCAELDGTQNELYLPIMYVKNSYKYEDYSEKTKTFQKMIATCDNIVDVDIFLGSNKPTVDVVKALPQILRNVNNRVEAALERKYPRQHFKFWINRGEPGILIECYYTGNKIKEPVLCQEFLRDVATLDNFNFNTYSGLSKAELNEVIQIIKNIKIELLF